jgi:hypothetical protein
MIGVWLVKRCMTVKRYTVGVCAALLLTALACAPPAMANSAWWHLNSDTVPASLPRDAARNEVQEIITTPGELRGVPASGIELTVGGKELGLFVTEPLAGALGLPVLNVANLQEALETVYGKDNVEVSGGAETAPGTLSPFVIKSINGGAGKTVSPLEISGVGIGEATGRIITEGRFSGLIVVMASNLGYESLHGAKAPVSFTDKLPHGLRAVSITGAENDTNDPVPLKCSVTSVTCSYTGEIVPYEATEIQIGVVVEEGASSGGVNEMTVAGGEALSASVRRAVEIGSESPPGEINEYEMTPEEENGSVDTQAGSHPFQLTTNITLNQRPTRIAAGSVPRWLTPTVAPIKNLDFNLPSGLIGNPTPVPQCTLAQFLSVLPNANGNECAPDTAIGMALVNVMIPSIGKAVFPVPVFNLEPAVGEPARFGFVITQGDAPVILDTSVRTGGDYGITVKVHNITETATFLSSLVTFWGVPGDKRHDDVRGWGCLYHNLNILESISCSPEEALHPPPLLSLPTACTGPLPNSAEAETWTQEGLESSLPSNPMPAMDGCNRLPFNPSVIVTPDGRAGSTPTGLNVDEHVSQLSTLAPDGLAESAIRGLTVTLPEGVAINPAGADGLLSCSMEQIGLESPDPPTCPEASKVGTVRIKTPLLPNALEGSVYLAQQSANPFGSLFGLYVYAQDPISGLSAKAAGELVANPATGQLETHFEADPLFVNDPRYAATPTAQFLPELPFEDLELHFFGGDRAPLAMPASCGTYFTTTKFLPWSGSAPTESSSAFQVISGPNGSPCHTPLPFVPTLTAGTTSIQAGGFSPFTMTMSREDGMQSLRSIEVHLPPGMSGTLSTVKLCGEEQADAGTCPADTEIGETIVSVGVGGDPFSVEGGKVYITGPYKGAPFGLSIVNPAKAGPFDLGKVIVRAKVEVDPTTTALTITTDTEGPYKLPTILDGIPLQIRHVNVDINRQNFAFNPTNCSPMHITGSLGSTEGTSSPVSVPFQITNCAVLAFDPKLTATTTGAASRKNGASLTVRLGYPAGPYDANIARVKVELPKALPSRLTTLQKACLAVVFEANPASCPAQSIVGHATATTPILPVPLSGPAYFVSHGGEAFPSLIVVLQGYGVTLHLVGSTYINPKTGITSSTFKTVPDAPVGTFELTLPQGEFSALAANGNLCRENLQMPTEFVGQNGALIKTTTRIATTGCPKAKQATHKKKAKRRKAKKKAKGPKHG